MESSRKRPLEQEPNSHINLSIKSQDGVSMYFKIPRTTSMLKVLQKYCFKRNFEYKAMQFLYNGERFPTRQTPSDLGMEENDEIEAMMHQSGGVTVLPQY